MYILTLENLTGLSGLVVGISLSLTGVGSTVGVPIVSPAVLLSKILQQD